MGDVCEERSQQPAEVESLVANYAWLRVCFTSSWVEDAKLFALQKLRSWHLFGTKSLQ